MVTSKAADGMSQRGRVASGSSRGMKQKNDISPADVEVKSKKGRGRKRNFSNYGIYILKVLKQLAPNQGISKKAVAIMNSFLLDLFDRMAVEAGRLCAHTGKNTLSSREISAAARLVLPGELAKHAVTEGMKSVQTLAQATGAEP